MRRTLTLKAWADPLSSWPQWAQLGGRGEKPPWQCQDNKGKASSQGAPAPADPAQRGPSPALPCVLCGFPLTSLCTRSPCSQSRLSGLLGAGPAGSFNGGLGPPPVPRKLLPLSPAPSISLITRRGEVVVRPWGTDLALCTVQTLPVLQSSRGRVAGPSQASLPVNQARQGTAGLLILSLLPCPSLLSLLSSLPSPSSPPPPPLPALPFPIESLEKLLCPIPSSPAKPLPRVYLTPKISPHCKTLPPILAP